MLWIVLVGYPLAWALVAKDLAKLHAKDKKLGDGARLWLMNAQIVFGPLYLSAFLLFSPFRAIYHHYLTKEKLLLEAEEEKKRALKEAEEELQKYLPELEDGTLTRAYNYSLHSCLTGQFVANCILPEKLEETEYNNILRVIHVGESQWKIQRVTNSTIYVSPLEPPKYKSYFVEID